MNTIGQNKLFTIPHLRNLPLLFLLTFPLAATLLLFAPPKTGAAPYQPEKTLQIETELLRAGESGGGKRRYYVQKTSATSSTGNGIGFFSGSTQSQPLSIFPLSADGVMSVKKNTNSTAWTVKNSLFLLGGFPLPLDILPVNQQQKHKLYRYSRTSGGRKFIQEYTVTVEPITSEVAEQNGWLKTTIQPETQLRIITVANSQGQAVSLQLWPANGNWWLYEETRFRHSWLLN